MQIRNTSNPVSLTSLLCKVKDAKSISKIGQAIVFRYKDIQGTGTIVLCDLACSLAQEHPCVQNILTLNAPPQLYNFDGSARLWQRWSLHFINASRQSLTSVPSVSDKRWCCAHLDRVKDALNRSLFENAGVQHSWHIMAAHITLIK